MRTFLQICFLALACFASAAVGRTMDRCSLARAMSKLGVPRIQLARWACIAEHESAYQTELVGPPNSDKSNDYGIFQINDRDWCQPESGELSKNLCGLSCNDLLDNDITQSVRCAQKVLAMKGWRAWPMWHYCSGNLPSIDDCFQASKL